MVSSKTRDDSKTGFYPCSNVALGNSTEKHILQVPQGLLDIYSKAEDLILNKDFNHGVVLLESVVKAFDCSQSQALLGFCLEFGLGITQDFKAAEKLYAAAGLQGNGLACARLSFLRRYGRPGVIIDRMEAEEWVKRVGSVASLSWLVKAADQFNLPAACYALGVCYHDGYLFFFL